MSIVQDFDLTHLDLLPLPGQGNTRKRWQTWARIAGCDLTLAKRYEAALARHRIAPAVPGALPGTGETPAYPRRQPWNLCQGLPAGWRVPAAAGP